MATQTPPLHLYHASGFLTDVLHPGIFYTGELQRWDEVESNEYLYATLFKDLCINLGISSAVDKKFMLNEFHTSENEKVLEFVMDMNSPPLTYQQLFLMPVFLYQIKFVKSDGWVPVVNESTTPGSEWKTKKNITRFVKREQINVKRWLDSRTVIIRHPRYKTQTRKPRWTSSNTSTET